MAGARNYTMWKCAISFGAGAGVGVGYAYWTSQSSSDLLSEDPGPTVILKNKNNRNNASTTYESAIHQSRSMVHRVKEELGIPGLCIAVDIDGRNVWTEGIGYADVENAVPCTPDTVMRIASISKSITMAALAKLWEEGKVDLDKPVQEYVPTFPKKFFNGETVEITTRMLTSHLSGIRHWKQNNENRDTDISNAPVDGSKEERGEFYLNERFKTVESALSIFKDDALVHKPGTKYLYSSPAWTLISAVMEKAAGESFNKILAKLFLDLGLSKTSLDQNEIIMYGRARYYIRSKNGRLVNAPCVDNSCKWAGGGLQSTVGDLTKFANAMLYCFQQTDSQLLPGYLKKETIEALWTANSTSKPAFFDVGGYGMGWVVFPKQDRYGGVEGLCFTVSHTGGAVGASSILLIKPSDVSSTHIPCGITVAIIANLQDVGLSKLAHSICTNFQRLNLEV